MGEHGLAECRRVQWKHRADLQDLQARVRAEDVMDDEHTIAVRDADPDGLVSPRSEQLGPGERACAQLDEVEVAGAQMEYLRAEVGVVSVLGDIHRSIAGQRRSHTVKQW